jgi:outer membrane receptor protein involved in Fe transport
MKMTILASVLWIALGTPLVMAQGEHDTETTKEVMKELRSMSLEELLEVKVTVASKTAENISDSPSSVTVFTRQEWLAMGVTTLEELLNFVPGFITTREIVYGQGSMVAARGQTTPQASYNILFMMDGQPLNDGVSGGALVHNRFLSLANLKQVEIIRGPGSALYGTSAFSGVVNLISITDANEAFVSTGNLHSKEAYLNLSKKGNYGQASLFARYFKDDGQTYTGLVDPKVPSTQDPRSGKEVSLTYTWQDKLRLNARHLQQEVRDFYQIAALSNGVNHYQTQQDLVHLNYHFLNTKQWELSFDTSYLTSQVAEMRELMSAATIQSLPKTVTGTGPKVAQVSGNVIEQHSWKLGLDGRYRWNEHHEWLAGLLWQRQTVDKFRNRSNYDDSAFIARPPAGILRYLGTVEEIAVVGDEGQRDLIGLYGQDKYRFNDHLAMTLGVRYDHYSDFGGTLNPRAAWIYSTDFNAKFKLMYGQAFRSPSVTQLSAQGFGNPNLKPERIKTTELAWLQEYTGGQTALTYFQNRSLGKIDTVLGQNGNRLFENTGDLTTAGWEFETLLTVVQGLSLRVAYTYLSKTEEQPRRFPKQTFSAIANYQKGLWNFNLNAYYYDEMEQQLLQGVHTLDDYWVLNGAVRYNFYKGLTVVGRVHNFLDEEFYSSSKQVRYVEGIPNRGRVYSLGVEIKF